MKLLNFALSFLLLMGCEKKDHKGPETNPDNILNIAVSSDYPPFIYNKAGKLEGFEVELITAIAGKLGKTVQFHDIAFQDIIKTVAKKQVDCAIASIGQTKKRAKEVDFTMPYHRSMTVIVVPYNASINSLDGLKGKTLGVESGTTYEEYFKKKKRNQFKGVKQLNRNKFADLLEAMHQRKCEAILTGYSEGYEMQSTNPDLKIIPIEDTVMTFAIALPKGSPLLDKINEVLLEMVKNGEIIKLEKQYFKRVVTEE